MLISTSRARLDSVKLESSSNDEPLEVRSSWATDGEWVVPEPWEVSAEEEVAPPPALTPGDALGLAPSISIPDERSGRTPARSNLPSVRKTAASRSSSAAPARRAYSPAALRRIPLGKHRRIRSASPLPLDPDSGTDGAEGTGHGGTSESIGIASSTSDVQLKSDVMLTVKAIKKSSKLDMAMREDISMVMRRRAMKGYGIKNVSTIGQVYSCIASEFFLVHS